MQAPKTSAILQQTVQTVSKPVVSFEQLKLKAQFSLTTVHTETVITKETSPAEAETVAEQPASYLSLEAAKQAISKFAHHKNISGGRQVFATLSTAVVSLNGPAIGIEIHNEVQREMLNVIKQDMLDYIRRDLGNNAVSIDITVSQHQHETKAYKPSDKFKFMAEKNPMLLELKKRFDLDIDY